MLDLSRDIDAFLHKQAHEFRHNPLGFIYFAFDEINIYDWQIDVLKKIGVALKKGDADKHQAIKSAVSSGHGIGKSALVAWLILWAMTTEADTKGVITANTETQLKSKTWAELGKWYNVFRYKNWFKFTATALFSSNTDYERTWRIDMIPWSERNTEAFAGLHNMGKRILLIYDEASAIPDAIWEVSEGALTDEDTEIIWCVFGNPTRNSGRFRECFGRLKYRWNHVQIDSRDVPGTNKSQIQQWIDDYGEDSDFVRVRVKGVFPRAGDNQFIPADIVIDAAERKLNRSIWGQAHKFIGVDVARFGSDQSVILRRQGDKVFEPVCYRGIDTMELAGFVYEQYKDWQADTIFIDGVGVGGGVVDRLTQLALPVIDVQAGAQAKDKRMYINVRAEMWGQMRDWLRGEVELPKNQELIDELTQPEYGFNAKMQIQLESKDDMKKRGLSSPDIADSLALTFFSNYRMGNSSFSGRRVTNRQAGGWD